MPASKNAVLSASGLLLGALICLPMNTQASPARYQLSGDLDVSFDQVGTFTEEYGYNTEDGFHYSQYFTFSFRDAGELHISFDFSGNIPVGKELKLSLGGFFIPTVYPDEFKWVFSEPHASIVVQSPNWPEGQPDGAVVPIAPLPSRLDFSLKITDLVAGKYKACVSGNSPLCETYGAEDPGLLYVGVGYSITPVPEPAVYQLGLIGGLLVIPALLHKSSFGRHDPNPRRIYATAATGTVLGRPIWLNRFSKATR
ncbi:MAG: hypothetical protein ACOZE7_21260, partial [Pseudomonadota bacterium]